MTADAFVADPRPAATVVLLRDSAHGPEVFLVRRHESTAFMGGAHVFPGGRVDAADRDGDAAWADGDSSPYHVAAARELFEEAGVLLARAANGHFVSLADAATHERFSKYRHAVHDGLASLRSVVDGEGLRLAAWGLAGGLLVAAMSTRALAGLLYGVSARDPLTFVGVALVLAGVSLLASYLPARRATRVDPLIALRCD